MERCADDLCQRFRDNPDRSTQSRVHHAKHTFFGRYFYLMLVIFLIIPSAIAFSPVWIGSEFREASFITPEENDKLQSICGRANITDHLWAVSILFHGNNRLGGAIISPYHILTVAHGFMKFSTGPDGNCMASQYRRIEELQKKRLVVYGGKCIRGHSTYLPNHVNCTKPDVQMNRIRSVLIDGRFAAGSCLDGHDFAIIELEHKIKFDNRTAPICLPTAMWPVIQNILTVSGWGRSNFVYQEGSPLIHEAPMLIDNQCRRPWSDRLPKDADDILCATSLNKSDYNAPRICHGDSGSGMEQRDERGRATLIGLASFGTQGCPSNLLARFTRVGYFLHEICQYTGVCSSARR